MKKYCRSEIDKRIWGVCSGFARYTNTDVALWRIGFLTMILTPLPIIMFYLIVTIATKSIEYLD